MAKTRLLLFVILLLGFGLTSTRFEKNTDPEYQIIFVQDGIKHELNSSENIIELKRKPFVIKVYLYNVLGVYASIHNTPVFYNVPDNKNFVEPENIGPMCMVEDQYNQDKDIIMTDSGFSYWYYEKKDTTSRFDKGAEDRGNYIDASMTVEKIYDSQNEQYITLSDMKDPLYFLFFTTKDKKGVSTKILYRKKVKVEFKD